MFAALEFKVLGYPIRLSNFGGDRTAGGQRLKVAPSVSQKAGNARMTNF
jgi:hypothetical protein